MRRRCTSHCRLHQSMSRSGGDGRPPELTGHRALIIDNFDSFTYNLVRLISQVCGVQPIVHPNTISPEHFDSLRQQVDFVVISPGPGRPDIPEDFGICEYILRSSDCSILGICLGHQGLASVNGAAIIRARNAFHGGHKSIEHEGGSMFSGVPAGFQAVSYNSLVVCKDSLPDCLRVTAWAGHEQLQHPDAEIMALEHRHKPIATLQFHPESISSEFGTALIRNFVRFYVRAPPSMISSPPLPPRLSSTSTDLLHLHIKKIEYVIDSPILFRAISSTCVERCVWLDTSLYEPGSRRFSYIATGDGPLSYLIEYEESNSRLKRRRMDGEVAEVLECNDVFSYMDEIISSLSLDADSAALDDNLPFDFIGGFVGFFGYEANLEAAAKSPQSFNTPDAAFIFADRITVIDHAECVTYLVCLSELNASSMTESRHWLESQQQLIQSLQKRPAPPPVQAPRPCAGHFISRDSDEQYRRKIRQCQELILAGESYELCLTTQWVWECSSVCKAASCACTTALLDSSLALYESLRDLNAAPFAAYFRVPGFALCCSSPERFMRIDSNRRVECRPIKGTRKRGADEEEDRALRIELANNPKDKAENLMIVDLIRHDLTRTCLSDSVVVPRYRLVRYRQRDHRRDHGRLFVVESYPAVLQLVSAIEGELRPHCTPLQCLSNAFPPGSMTGAPKLRSMRLLRGLEARRRGVYSGTLGYISLNRCLDFNVIIRSIVCTPQQCSIGAGGAIVAMSDAESELQEMKLKSRAPIDAVRRHLFSV